MALKGLVHVAKRVAWNARMRGYAITGRMQKLRAWELGGVRILTYHGVYRDGDEHLPWIPHYFVSERQLADQLNWLRQAGDVVPLSEGLALLREGTRRRPLVYCVTFDDGYFNNLALAAPILSAHKVTATVFLATGFIERGGEVPMWLQGRFLHHLVSTGQLGLRRTEEELDVIRSAAQWGRYRPADMAPVLAGLWREASDLISLRDRDATRMLTYDEVRRLIEYGIELGAHTVTHPFLSQLSAPQRRSEMRESVEFVRALSGKAEIAFAYPNGKPQDFGQFDIDVLRELDVAGAVTTVPGVNLPSDELDVFRLHRLPVSRLKTRDDFMAMLSGLYDRNAWWQPPD